MKSFKETPSSQLSRKSSAGTSTAWHCTSVSRPLDYNASRPSLTVCFTNAHIQQKWHKLMGTLRSLGPGIPGGRDLLSVLQKITPRPGNQARISTSATMALSLWKKLFCTMHAQPAHLQKRFLHPSAWFDATNACTYTTLNSVFFNSAGDAFVWQWLLPPSLWRRVHLDNNPHGDISINALELAAHLLQFLLKTPHMSPLEHTLDGVNSTAAHGWNVRRSVLLDDVIAVLLAW